MPGVFDDLLARDPKRLSSKDVRDLHNQYKDLNHYELFGVTRKQTSVGIKTQLIKQYKAYQVKYHSDKVAALGLDGHTVELLLDLGRKINGAYADLTDSAKKDEYDKWHPSPPSPAAAPKARPPKPQEQKRKKTDTEVLHDFFNLSWSGIKEAAKQETLKNIRKSIKFDTVLLERIDVLTYAALLEKKDEHVKQLLLEGYTLNHAQFENHRTAKEKVIETITRVLTEMDYADFETVISNPGWQNDPVFKHFSDYKILLNVKGFIERYLKGFSLHMSLSLSEKDEVQAQVKEILSQLWNERFPLGKYDVDDFYKLFDELIDSLKQVKVLVEKGLYQDIKKKAELLLVTYDKIERQPIVLVDETGAKMLLRLEDKGTYIVHYSAHIKSSSGGKMYCISLKNQVGGIETIELKKRYDADTQKSLLNKKITEQYKPLTSLPNALFALKYPGGMNILHYNAAHQPPGIENPVLLTLLDDEEYRWNVQRHLDEKDETGSTPLHYVVKKEGNYNVARRMFWLSAGNRSIRDSDGHTVYDCDKYDYLKKAEREGPLNRPKEYTAKKKEPSAAPRAGGTGGAFFGSPGPANPRDADVRTQEPKHEKSVAEMLHEFFNLTNSADIKAVAKQKMLKDIRIPEYAKPEDRMDVLTYAAISGKDEHVKHLLLQDYTLNHAQFDHPDCPSAKAKVIETVTRAFSKMDDEEFERITNKPEWQNDPVFKHLSLDYKILSNVKRFIEMYLENNAILNLMPDDTKAEIQTQARQFLSQFWNEHFPPSKFDVDDFYKVFNELIDSLSKVRMLIERGFHQDIKTKAELLLLCYDKTRKHTIVPVDETGAEMLLKDAPVGAYIVHRSSFFFSDVESIYSVSFKKADGKVEDRAFRKSNRSKTPKFLLEMKVTKPLDVFPVPLFSLRYPEGKNILHYNAAHQPSGIENPVLSTLLEEKKYELLVKKHINAQDKTGSTPLHYAVQKKGNSDLIQKMIKLDASTTIKDKKGKTPLDDDTHKYLRNILTDKLLDFFLLTNSDDIKRAAANEALREIRVPEHARPEDQMDVLTYAAISEADEHVKQLLLQGYTLNSTHFEHQEVKDAFIKTVTRAFCNMDDADFEKVASEQTDPVFKHFNNYKILLKVKEFIEMYLEKNTILNSIIDATKIEIQTQARKLLSQFWNEHFPPGKFDVDDFYKVFNELIGSLKEVDKLVKLGFYRDIKTKAELLLLCHDKIKKHTIVPVDMNRAKLLLKDADVGSYIVHRSSLFYSNDENIYSVSFKKEAALVENIAFKKSNRSIMPNFLLDRELTKPLPVSTAAHALQDTETGIKEGSQSPRPGS